MSKPVFVYVDGRGNGERVRFVLAGANVDYEEKNLTTKEERLALVESGKLITDQVPLLSIDGLDLVQSWSIVRYIGQTRGLVPANDPAAFAKVDIIAESVRDYETAAGLTGYGWTDKEEHKIKIKTAIAKFFPRFEKMISAGDNFCIGDKPYYCDFVLLNVLLYTEEVLPGTLAGFPRLKALKDKLCELPQIQAFLTSSKRKGLVTEEYIKLVKEVFY